MEYKIRTEVKKHYGGIAESVLKGKTSSCCSSSACCSAQPDIGYGSTDLTGLPKDAVNASLGCANPLLFAKIKEGECVLDLGSGGGIDVLAASKYVGESGKVYGLDMTDEMLALANQNKAEMGAANVDFLKGYIEDIPLKDELVDVVMSNCVINLSENKEKAVSEAYRVLKQGGRLAVADMISLKPISPAIRKQAELWCGCLAGTIGIDEYQAVLEKAGFKEIEITSVSVYTKEVLESIYGTDYLHDFNAEQAAELYGAFASAHIKALK